MISANTTLAIDTTVATTPTTTTTEKSIKATEQSVWVIVAVAFGSSMLTLVIGVAICLVRRYTHESYFYIHLFSSDARRRRTWQRSM